MLQRHQMALRQMKAMTRKNINSKMRERCIRDYLCKNISAADFEKQRYLAKPHITDEEVERARQESFNQLSLFSMEKDDDDAWETDEFRKEINDCLDAYICGEIDNDQFERCGRIYDIGDEEIEEARMVRGIREYRDRETDEDKFEDHREMYNIKEEDIVEVAKMLDLGEDDDDMSDGV